MYKRQIEYLLFNKITPNPNSYDCDEATKLSIAFGAQAVIGIGGGSPIDSAKTVAIMSCYPEHTTSDLYELKFAPEKALPIIAIIGNAFSGANFNSYKSEVVCSG